MTIIRTSPPSKRSSAAVASTNNRSTSATADHSAVLEEVRQLRAAMAIYRQLVNRLLAERADCPKLGRRGIETRSAA